MLEIPKANSSRLKNLLYSPLFHLLLVSLIGLFAYSNTFNAPFVFDDRPNIIDNPVVKDLSFFLDTSKAKNLPDYYIPLKSRYVGYLSFALNYKFHGLDVTGYHVVNLLIHLFNAMLVYFLVILSFKTPLFNSVDRDSSYLLALFSSLLFVCHPVQTQAVTYIVQRFTSLASLFYLLSVVTFVRWRLSSIDAPRLFSSALIFYVISLISAILAMKTKEISFTLPLVIVLYEFLFFKERLIKRILFLFPFLLTMLIIPLTLLSHMSLNEATRLQSDLPRHVYLFTQFRVIVTYLRLLFFPINQNLDYDYPVYSSFSNPNVFVSFFFLLSLFILAIYLIHKSKKSPQLISLRLAGFGILWFFITLSVESSIIPIEDVIFEHRVYLPSIGVFVVVGTLLVKLMTNVRTYIKALLSIILVIIFLFLACLTVNRNSVWSDELALWHDVIKKSPRKVRAIINLGNIYARRGDFNRGIEFFNRAIGINPEYPPAFYNRGLAFYKSKQYNRAVEDFQFAILLNPYFIDALMGLADTYLYLNRYDQAIELYTKVLTLNPYLKKAYNNRGIAYAKKGLNQSAISDFKQALLIDPSYEDARYNLNLISRNNY